MKVPPHGKPLAYLKRELASPTKLELVGEDAHRVARAGSGGKPRVTVVVVGETARAANFSLNGYARETNPELGLRGVVNFPKTTSCGTSTAVSVPCMFLDVGHDNYKDSMAGNREGLLDVLQRAGVEVLWRDNNSGCKGALAVNVPNKFTQAARYLVESGAWTANGQGSRIWTTTQGLFLVWKGAVDDVISYFDQNKVKGTPRGPDSLGNVLLDFGLFEANPDGDLYWVVAPDALANPETGKVIRLKCVKLASHQTLYLMCLAAVKHFEAKKGTCGIHTLRDMVEHLELVNELSLSQAKVPVEDLRKFSLDLLRSMRTGLAKRA